MTPRLCVSSASKQRLLYGKPTQRAKNYTARSNVEPTQILPVIETVLLRRLIHIKIVIDDASLARVESLETEINLGEENSYFRETVV